MAEQDGLRQLQLFEKRGDLTRQLEVLQQALGGLISPLQLRELLSLAQDSAQRHEQLHPPSAFAFDALRATLQVTQSLSGEVLKEVALPKEPGALSADLLNWSPIGSVELFAVDVRDGKLVREREYGHLMPLQRQILLNPLYAALNVRDFHGQMKSLAIRNWTYGQMPIEAVASLPHDLAFSAQHPVIAVSDRGAGKLHLIARDTLRPVKSWKVALKGGKKTVAVAFHPDGKRLFASSYEVRNLSLIDRNIVQKKLPLNVPHVLGAMACSPKGDLLYVLGINPDTRRPDILVIETTRYQLVKTLPLEGEAFSVGADPRDIFEISPDGRTAVVMVSRNQPALFTPTLLVVDLSTGQITDQHVLSPQQKPINMAFLARQLVPPEIRLLPMLLHTPGIDSAKVRAALGLPER